MNIGEEYYCKYTKNGEVRVSFARVKCISENRTYAEMSNGKKIDIITGKQHGTDKFWHPVDPGDRSLETYRLVGKARKWFRKMLSVNDIAVNMYRRLVKKTDIDTRAYYHNLSHEAIRLIKDIDINFLRENYRQPVWCYNPNALNGCLGCKHLLLGRIKKPVNCMLCRYYIEPHMSKYRRLRMSAGLSISMCNRLLGINDYSQVEAGERPATTEELDIMSTIFGVGDWTLGQVTEYFKDYNYKNPDINVNINIKQLLDEKKNIKF